MSDDKKADFCAVCGADVGHADNCSAYVEELLAKLDAAKAEAERRAAIDKACVETGCLFVGTTPCCSRCGRFDRAGMHARAERDLAQAQADEFAAQRDRACAALAQMREPFDRWPTVYAFALAMIAKLDRHKPKKGGREGWLNDDPLALLRRVREETNELDRAVSPFGATADVLGEAADVANMAMMVADAYDGIDVAALSSPPDEWLAKHDAAVLEEAAKAADKHQAHWLKVAEADAANSRGDPESLYRRDQHQHETMASVARDVAAGLRALAKARLGKETPAPSSATPSEETPT